MLPSFRLIAATFLCGFLVVYAGLRMAVSLHDIHEGLPVMAAHAAPVPAAPAADSDGRRGLAAVPVMYDLRFAVSTVSPTLVRGTPTVYDRPAPPLAIIPQDLVEQDSLEPARQTPEPENKTAAIQADAPASVAPVAPAIPDAAAEAPQPAVPTDAAVERQAAPELETSAAEPLIPEPDTTASVDPPAAAADPAPPAVPAPAAKPKVAKPAPKAAVKVARKKRVRTAQHAAPANNAFGANPTSNPYGIPQQ